MNAYDCVSWDVVAGKVVYFHRYKVFASGVKFARAKMKRAIGRSDLEVAIMTLGKDVILKDRQGRVCPVI